MPLLRADETEQLEHQLAELRQSQQRLEMALAAHRAELRGLAAKIRSAEINLHHLQRDASYSGSTSVGSIADAAEACLRRSGKPMRVVEMVPLLQEDGKLLRSESAYSTLFRTLSRSTGRFEHVPGRRGYWRLVA
jgi:septal ring factor EnvC (AmiA/AmiB activator)